VRRHESWHRNEGDVKQAMLNVSKLQSDRKLREVEQLLNLHGLRNNVSEVSKLRSALNKMHNTVFIL
jgi:hypothetical protein